MKTKSVPTMLINSQSDIVGNRKDRQYKRLLQGQGQVEKIVSFVFSLIKCL
jgi:hypothetical protein